MSCVDFDIMDLAFDKTDSSLLVLTSFNHVELIGLIGMGIYILLFHPK